MDYTLTVNTHTQTGSTLGHRPVSVFAVRHGFHVVAVVVCQRLLVLVAVMFTFRVSLPENETIWREGDSKVYASPQAGSLPPFTRSVGRSVSWSISWSVGGLKLEDG